MVLFSFLILAFLLLGGLGWIARWSLVDCSRRRFYLVLGVRSLIVALLVFALAGATLLRSTQEKVVILLVNETQTLNAEANEKVQTYLNQTSAFHFPFSLMPQPGKNTLEAAVALALAEIPSDKVHQWVLLSPNDAAIAEAIAEVIPPGVLVSTVPLPETQTPMVRLSDLRVLSPVRQNEPALFEVVVQSNHETEATIAVFYGDTFLVEETRTLQSGEHSFQYQFTPDEKRQEFLTAILETAFGEETIRTLVTIEGPPRVLLLESRTESIEHLAVTLREQGIELEIRNADEIPQTLDEWDAFDAIILSDIPATAFSLQQLETLGVYVRDLGGGLLMLGGENSFAPGGYALSPLEEILPVSCRFEKEKETPSLALGLVLDHSGSMGGEKLEWAKDAAKSVVELLTPSDFLTVIAFDSTPHLIVPIQNVTNTDNIKTTISTIEAAGGTSLYPALASAFEQLNQVSAKLKHLIVLTDAYGPDGDFEGITRQMSNALITVSTIGIGEANERLLRTIADNGGGRYYPCNDPAMIPQIFLKETTFASKASIREKSFVPVLVTPTPLLAGIPLDTMPPLLGFVATQPKPTSRLIFSTETGEPLLAWGRVGLGVSAAWTSDTKNRWAARWIPWEHFGTFWTQLVRSIMRRPLERGVEIEITEKAGRIHVTLDAVDDLDRFINQAQGSLNVVTPDFTREEFPLLQTAPGRYEAAFPAEQPGGYHIHASLQSGERQIASQNRSVTIRNKETFRFNVTGEDFLQQIAASTGGEYNLTPEALLKPEPGRFAQTAVPLYPYLLSIAAVLFVLDLFLRKRSL